MESGDSLDDLLKKLLEAIPEIKSVAKDIKLGLISLDLRSHLGKIWRSGYDADDGEDHLPYPYIFKPPEPPDDFAMRPQSQLRVILKEKDPEGEVNCQYCGIKLAKEEQITHSCKNKPE